jgi:Ca-activated chloride channel homolog
MTFIWPVMLLSFLLLPLFVLFYVWQQRRRQRIAAQFASLGLAQTGAGGRRGLLRHIPPALFLAAFALLLFSLSRPQAAFQLPRIEGTVILLFDVSGSMAAEDLQPNRIEAAKIVAQDFVLRQPPTVQIGVVAFSNNGFAVQPPTNDQDAILAAIQRLTPQLGTSLGQGIYASLNTIDPVEAMGRQRGVEEEEDTVPTPLPVPPGSDNSALIIMLTDGENLEAPDPLEAAQAAADRGVRIFPVGIGSAAGTILEINGFTVHTRLDEETLRQIAALTDGEYFNAQNEAELGAVYENIRPQLVIRPENTEVTSVFAGAGILALLAGGLFSLLWFSRLP